jgi:hypothetical protein
LWTELSKGWLQALIYELYGLDVTFVLGKKRQSGSAISFSFAQCNSSNVANATNAIAMISSAIVPNAPAFGTSVPSCNNSGVISSADPAGVCVCYFFSSVCVVTHFSSFLSISDFFFITLILFDSIFCRVY